MPLIKREVRLQSSFRPCQFISLHPCELQILNSLKAVCVSNFWQPTEPFAHCQKHIWLLSGAFLVFLDFIDFFILSA